jgi:hypothetical protein
LRQIVFEHMINDRDGIDDQRIIRRPHSQPDQLEKIPADDISGGCWPPPLAISMTACWDQPSRRPAAGWRA